MDSIGDEGVGGPSAVREMKNDDEVGRVKGRERTHSKCSFIVNQS